MPVARNVRRAFSGASAAKVLSDAGFGRGREVFGFNGGQFSSIDLIDAVLDYTGPASVVIGTWTAAAADMTRVHEFLESGRIVSTLWIVDRSFRARQPELCALLRAKFGDDAIRVVNTHAKFVLASADEWQVLIQTSMNLNQNRRIENFWVADCPALFEAYNELVGDIFSLQNAGEGFSKNSHVEDVHRGLVRKEPAGVFAASGARGWKTW